MEAVLNSEIESSVRARTVRPCKYARGAYTRRTARGFGGSRNVGAPKVSVIIPSFDGHRDGCVPRLLASLDAQSYRDFETIVVTGIAPQGRAINAGVQRSQGEYLVIVDDDSRFADSETLERLIECLSADPSIGMAGASLVLDPEASVFQRRAARQFPRLCTPEIDEVTDSDLACHGCCGFPRRVFEKVGGEREDIVRGLDPDLRARLRAAGYRVVLVPGARIHHPLPEGWRRLVRTFFRNGYGSAYSQKFQPQSIYETHEDVSDAKFRPRRSLAYRAARFPARLAWAAARGQRIRLIAYVAYALGYSWGWLRAQPIGSRTQRGSDDTCTQANDSRAA